MSDCTYEIKKQGRSGLFTISFNGVEIADSLELHEVLLMLETLMRGDNNV